MLFDFNWCYALMPKSDLKPFSLPEALLAAFDTNERINQYLL